MRNRAMLLPIICIVPTALICAIAHAEEGACTLDIPLLSFFRTIASCATWDRPLLRCEVRMGQAPLLQSKLEAVPAVFSSSLRPVNRFP